jgi:hypothetical protein
MLAASDAASTAHPPASMNIEGRWYTGVGLERINGVAAYDVTDRPRRASTTT